MQKPKAGRSDGTSHVTPKAGRTNKLITRPRREGMIYVGLNVHRESIPVATVDRKGMLQTYFVGNVE